MLTMCRPSDLPAPAVAATITASGTLVTNITAALRETVASPLLFSDAFTSLITSAPASAPASPAIFLAALSLLTLLDERLCKLLLTYTLFVTLE